MSRLGLRLTPHGRLSVEDQDDGPDIDAAASIRLIDAFARGTGYGLVWLGAAEVGRHCPLCLFGGVTSQPFTSGRFVYTRPAWKRKRAECCRACRRRPPLNSHLWC